MVLIQLDVGHQLNSTSELLFLAVLAPTLPKTVFVNSEVNVAHETFW